jgi:hypothetical protein
LKRETLDKLISSTGIIIAALLVALSAALFWAHDFIHTQVHEQLLAQKIEFPPADSPALASLAEVDRVEVSKYAGQELTTGNQAKVFADNYIAAHLKESTGGQTYSELSNASRANPADEKLAGQVQTAFRGETLRGLLLNAYAFDTMALVASYIAYGSLFAAGVLVILAFLGFTHAKAVTAKKRR